MGFFRGHLCLVNLPSLVCSRCPRPFSVVSLSFLAWTDVLVDPSVSNLLCLRPPLPQVLRLVRLIGFLRRNSTLNLHSSFQLTNIRPEFLPRSKDLFQEVEPSPQFIFRVLVRVCVSSSRCTMGNNHFRLLGGLGSPSTSASRSDHSIQRF